MKKVSNLGQSGFTLIEILMAVLVIVIMAVIGITQFTNFSTDAKNASTKANLAILRNSIGAMNGLERVRCRKTSALFPDVQTLINNNITGCSQANIAGNATGTITAACNPHVLVDPNTNAVYASNCGTAFDGTAVGIAYLTLIPLADQPYIQNAIPNNPWTAPTATSAPNLVTKDTQPAVSTVHCLNAPVDTTAPFTNAKLCASASAPFANVVTESGWCYCQETGQIWANTGGNDGKSAGTGNESTF